MNEITPAVIKRFLAAVFATGCAVVCVFAYLAHPDADAKLFALLGLGALGGYGYAAFPGLFPSHDDGEARPD